MGESSSSLTVYKSLKLTYDSFYKTGSDD